MSRVLSDRALDWLEMFPPVLREDPWLHGIVDAMAREYDRLEGQALQLAAGLIPTGVNEATVAIWEALLGLPINPPGTSTETRVGLVRSRLLRGDGSGAEWENLMKAATANTFRYTEHDSGDPQAPMYWLRIDTALPTGVTIETLRDYIRRISPANLHLEIQGGQTYAQLKAAKPTYTAARDGYPNYDNMRFGAA